MPIHFSTYSFPGSFQRVAGFRAWPFWARGVLLVAALPGIVIAALSLLLIVVSILALSLLALPTYAAITRVLGKRSQRTERSPGNSPGAKRVEATVME